MPRPTRRTAAATAAAVCLVGGGVLTGARALVPAHPTAAGPQPAASASLSLPPPPPTGEWTPLGLTIDRSVQSIKRAKLSINLAPFRGLAYLNAVPTGTGYEDATGLIYVTDPGGPADQFGEFAPVNVKTLAFGTIPVSATVHITQVRDSDGIVPFTVKLHFSTTPVPPPTPLPCSPPAVKRNLCYYTDSPHLSGEVDVRIDNVAIDQVPVDVGANCHTATPATMELSAPAGYYSVDTHYIPPDLYLPFVNGGTLSGPVNVPAFTGCTNGSDDLSSVMTAMVAGPGNTLSSHQDGPLVVYPPPEPTTK